MTNSDTSKTQPLAGDDRWESMARVALESSLDGILIHDLEGRLLYFNAAAARNAGLTPDEFAALPPWGFAGHDSAASRPKRLKALAESGPQVFTSSSVDSAGERVTTEIHARYVKTDVGPVIVSVTHDVTERAKAEEALQRLAFHDALTGLANRALFDDRLELAMAGARRRGEIVGIVYVDVDDFKDVNDSYGHEVGDRVLRALGERLQGAVRQEDTVARLGGDEFVIIVPHLGSTDDLDRIAAKLAAHVSAPVSIDDERIEISASMGLALFDADADDARSLVMRADIAMYEAKRAKAAGHAAVRHPTR